MRSIILPLGLVAVALAHGDHSRASQKPLVGENADWTTRHMAEEHHIAEFDAVSFFTLHDFNADGRWEPDEMLRTYGLFDDSNKQLPQTRRDEIRQQLLTLLDTDRDGSVSLAEWLAFDTAGKKLPDLGTGPGHHGDDEYEYEIHHWEKYHDENTKEEDLTHPEDIEHFRKHDELEAKEERLAEMGRHRIIEQNIPDKFRPKLS